MATLTKLTHPEAIEWIGKVAGSLNNHTKVLANHEEQLDAAFEAHRRAEQLIAAGEQRQKRLEAQLAQADEALAIERRRSGQLHAKLITLVKSHNGLVADYGIMAQRLLALESRGGAPNWWECWTRMPPGRN